MSERRSDVGVQNLVKKKGVHEVLNLLKEGDRSFNELTEELNLSPNTVSTRLQELRENGFVAVTSVLKGERAYKKYKITERGEKLSSDLKRLKNMERKICEKWGIN